MKLGERVGLTARHQLILNLWNAGLTAAKVAEKVGSTRSGIAGQIDRLRALGHEGERRTKAGERSAHQPAPEAPAWPPKPTHPRQCRLHPCQRHRPGRPSPSCNLVAASAASRSTGSALDGLLGADRGERVVLPASLEDRLSSKHAICSRQRAWLTKRVTTT